MSSTPSQPKRSESLSGRSSSFTGPKYMPHIADPAYCDASLPSRSSSDSMQGTGPPPLPNHQQQRDPTAHPGGHLLSSNEIQVYNKNRSITKLSKPQKVHVTYKFLATYFFFQNIRH